MGVSQKLVFAYTKNKEIKMRSSGKLHLFFYIPQKNRKQYFFREGVGHKIIDFNNVQKNGFIAWHKLLKFRRIFRSGKQHPLPLLQVTQKFVNHHFIEYILSSINITKSNHKNAHNA